MLYKISWLDTYFGFKNYVILHGNKPGYSSAPNLPSFKNYVILHGNKPAESNEND